MKQIFTLLILTVTLTAQAQTTYNITSNRTWTNSNSNAIPTNCVNCTINISSGVTLTLDADVTLQNCSFIGGTVATNSKTMTLQTSGGKTYFTNTKLNVTGTSVVKGSAPIVITGSVFKFYSTSSFNPQKQLDIDDSQLYFLDNSYFNATGGPVNMMNKSILAAGDGTLKSAAYLYFNGPTLNLYDASTIMLGNNNNYYFNWSSYNSKTNNKSYNTTNNKLNCDNAYPNRCQSPNVYGPATMNSTGLSASTTLPVVLTDFTTTAQGNTIVLNWSTQQESNSAYFIIERSADGINWSTQATVNAKGNSSVVSKYSYTDVRPLANANYYRLKMVDLDNSFQYSKINSVRISTSGSVSVYPNPATTNVYVSLPATISDNATLRLFNTAGQLMQQLTLTKGNGSTVTVPVQQYTAGTYLLQITDASGFKQSNMLVINK